MKRVLCLLGGLLLIGPAQADRLDELLENIKRGQVESQEINRERESRFLRDQQAQKKLLDEARREVSGLDRRAGGLRKTFSANEQELKRLTESLADKSGDLEQLKSVVRQAAADAHSLLAESLVTAQFPARLERLVELSTAEALPQVGDIEDLWYELQREMTQNGRVVRFETEVFDQQGLPRNADVLRVGLFAALADGDYLEYHVADRRLEVLPVQPGGGLLGLGLARDADTVLIDPTRGLLFGLLVERPGLSERLRQGGLVGYLIMGLGALGLLMAVFQFLYLGTIGRRMSAQLSNLSSPQENNPLGRVLSAYSRAARGADLETIELQLDESILKETPRLERLQGTIKLLAAVAPLMGLLGTVTGMIETFQAITLFGTGDAKLMAGGISQALMTTVLGLVVAIPLLFLHSLVATRSRALIQVLDEQSAGLVARAQEASGELRDD